MGDGSRPKKKLQNHDFSILCNRCIGGVITHAVGEQFRSPTVNLIIDDNAFLYFCEHVKEFADCPIELPTQEELKLLPRTSFPVGVLRGKDNLPDIPIFFMHFKTFEQAKEKWELRYKRINYDNICIMMDCKMHATKNLLDEYEKLPFERKVVFSHYDVIQSDGQVAFIQRRNMVTVYCTALFEGAFWNTSGWMSSIILNG